MKSKHLYSLLFFLINLADGLTTVYGASIGGQEKNQLMRMLIEINPWIFFVVKISVGALLSGVIFAWASYVERIKPGYKYRRKTRALFHAGNLSALAIIGVTVLNNGLWILGQI